MVSEAVSLSAQLYFLRQVELSDCGKLVTTIPGLFSTSFVSTAEREHLLSSGSSKNRKTDLHQSALNYLPTAERITVASGIELSDCPGFLLEGEVDKKWGRCGSKGKSRAWQKPIFLN